MWRKFEQMSQNRFSIDNTFIIDSDFTAMYQIWSVCSKLTAMWSELTKMFRIHRKQYVHKCQQYVRNWKKAITSELSATSVQNWQQMFRTDSRCSELTANVQNWQQMFRIDRNMFRTDSKCSELTAICSEMTAICSKLTTICLEWELTATESNMFRIDRNKFRIDRNMFRIDRNMFRMTGICSELARFCSWTTAYTSPPVIWEPKIYKVLKNYTLKVEKKIPNFIKKISIKTTFFFLNFWEELEKKSPTRSKKRQIVCNNAMCA